MKTLLKMLNKKWFLWLIIAAITVLFVRRCGGVSKENKRLEDNQTALFEDVTFYRTQDRLNAASVQQLTLTNSELEKYNEDLVKTAKSLNLKIKRLESASRTAMESNYQIVAELQEKVIYVDGKTDTVRCMEFKDPYIDFNACEMDDSLHANIRTYDTLVQFVHRVPYQWWFFKFGTKAIRQEVLSKNPYTTITFTEYIKLKKRK
jgi:hypothetical protein